MQASPAPQSPVAEYVIQSVGGIAETTESTHEAALKPGGIRGHSGSGDSRVPEGTCTFGDEGDGGETDVAGSSGLFPAKEGEGGYDITRRLSAPAIGELEMEMEMEMEVEVEVEVEEEDAAVNAVKNDATAEAAAAAVAAATAVATEAIVTAAGAVEKEKEDEKERIRRRVMMVVKDVSIDNAEVVPVSAPSTALCSLSVDGTAEHSADESEAGVLEAELAPPLEALAEQSADASEAGMLEAELAPPAEVDAEQSPDASEAGSLDAVSRQDREPVAEEMPATDAEATTAPRLTTPSPAAQSATLPENIWHDQIRMTRKRTIEAAAPTTKRVTKGPRLPPPPRLRQPVRRLYTIAFTWPAGASWLSAHADRKRGPSWYADRITELVSLRAADGRCPTNPNELSETPPLPSWACESKCQGYPPHASTPAA